MKRSYLAGLALLMVMAFGAPAQSAILLEGWTLDLEGVDGLSSAFVIPDVSEITFTGVAHGHNFDNIVPNFVGDVGEYTVTDGLLFATDLIAGGVSVGSDYDINKKTATAQGFKLTFDFSVNSVLTAVQGGGLATSFTHIDVGVNPDPLAADNILDIWVANLASSNKANVDTGAGFTDGVKIASFKMLPGGGGDFSAESDVMDGNDDASFALLWALAGVLWKDGQDLSEWDINNDIVLLAMTDSNYDADPDGNNLLDKPKPAAWPFPLDQAGFPNDFFAKEDGSAVLAVVPEPSTIILLGGGLLGLGIIARRRSKG